MNINNQSDLQVSRFVAFLVITRVHGTLNFLMSTVLASKLARLTLNWPALFVHPIYLIKMKKSKNMSSFEAVITR